MPAERQLWELRFNISLMTKQDRHPIDFDTAGTVEMGVTALVLGLEGPLLFMIMARQGTTLLVPVGILLLTVVISLTLIWMLWRPWSIRWNFRPPSEQAEVRTMQSLSGFNNCVRLAADDYGLHATLNRPFRWMAAEPFSIPWSEMVWMEQRASGRFSQSSKVRVSGKCLVVPSWVYEAAERHHFGVSGRI